MSIFEKFYQAVNQAIANYQDQKTAQHKSIHPERLQDIEKLQALLNKSLQKQDAGWLHNKLTQYLQTMKVRFWEQIPIFDSELRKTIRAVLENPKFMREKLQLKELMELRQKITETAEHNRENIEKIARLKQKIGELKTQLAESNQNSTLLEEENIILKKTINALSEEPQNDVNQTILTFQQTILQQNHTINTLEIENAALKRKLAVFESCAIEIETTEPDSDSILSPHYT